MVNQSAAPSFQPRTLRDGSEDENIRALAPALIGVVAGLWIIRRVPASFFYKFITWSLAIVSVKLIWDGL